MAGIDQQSVIDRGPRWAATPALALAIALACLGLALVLGSKPTVAQAAGTCELNRITGAGGTQWEVQTDDADWYEGNLLSGVGKEIRYDGLDGYSIHRVNGVSYENPDPDTGCTRSLGGREISFGEDEISGIGVKPQLYLDAKRPAARTITTLRNLTKDPITFTFRWAGDLGSDNGTLVARTSSGDKVANADDAWATSCENYSDEDDGCAAGPAYRDPELAHIWEGPKGPHDSAELVEILNNSFGYMNVEFEITLQGGQRTSLMNWVYLNRSIKAANKVAAEMATEPAWLFAGLTKGERKRIRNW